MGEGRGEGDGGAEEVGGPVGEDAGVVFLEDLWGGGLGGGEGGGEGGRTDRDIGGVEVEVEGGIGGTGKVVEG